MAKLATLVDAFTAATVNTSLWANSSVGQYTLDTARDLLKLNVGTASNTFYSFGSTNAYDGTGSSIYAQVWPAMTGSGTVSTALKLDAGSSNAASVVVWGDGTFTFRITTAGVFAETALPTYDPSAHRWWRVSEAGGSFSFATSPDGQTWTTLATSSYTWNATGINVYFQTGTSTTQSAGLFAAIAHVNTPAGGDAYPKVATLQEPFTGASLNTSVWNATTAGQYTLDTVNDQLLLNVGTTAGTYYNLGAAGPYDATGSVLYAQVTPPPLGNGGNGGTTATMKLDAGQNNAVQVLASAGGYFSLQVQRNGTYVSASLPTYDPHAHRWWRLTESSSAFTFATSPDGWTWTDRATLSYAFPFTSCQVYFQTGAPSNDQPSGLTAVIAHINTRLGGTLNLAWPRIEDAWGAFWTVNAGDFPLDRFVEVTDRTRGTVSASRGRQYETDQVRAGEASLTLANDDAALDPTNTAGPWHGYIQPYQPYRRRAQWPPTVNLLDQGQATCGDGYAAGSIPTGVNGLDIGSFTDSSGGSIVATSSAWQGSNVFQFSVPSGTAGATRICYTPRYGVIPGQTYTVQIRARNVTASTSLSVRAFVGYYTSLNVSNYNTGTAATLTGSATAAWTTLTATVTIPAGMGGMYCGLRLDSAAAAATCSIQVDGWQLEKGSTASAWQAPGVTYPVYAGFLERWPSSWDMDGKYGMVQPTAVDAFALLSQKTLSDPLTQEINSNSPRFLYKLDDPAGATSIADWTGNNPPAQLALSKYGAGSLVFGTSITSTSAGGTYTGSSGTVATLNNSNPGTNSVAGGATFIKLGAAGITGPADPTTWTRMIAFRYTGPTPTAAACMWSSMDGQRANGNPSGSHIYVYLGTDGKPVLAIQGPTGTGNNYVFGGATNCADGNWHLLVFGYSESAGQLILAQDGVSAFAGSLTSAYTPTGIVGDSLGGFVDVTVGNGTTWNFKGDISFAAEFSGYLSSTAISNLYAAWKSACAGESTSARYSRILRYAGYTGQSTVQSGLTTSMGPANIEGQDAVSALQAVVDTEGGQHFVGRDGAVQFRARSARYNATTPAYTFGERADLGEWPYEEVTLDYDSTHLSNQVTVTQEPTGQNFYAQDSTSITNYFPRSMSRTINSSSDAECQDAADYLLSRYKQPITRVSTVKLHPSANPALWGVCLALELGTRVRVMRRPPGVPAIQVDCFVENIAWEFGTDGDAWCTLECSPADLTPYGVVAAWHTTLGSSTAAGVTSLTINAPQVTQVYSQTFATAGTWRVVTGTGQDVGPITVASDGGTTAAQATTYTVMEDSTSIPYDPTLTYRVSATIRTATLPTSTPPLVYVGLTGLAADGTRVNINGVNTIASQYYCAARASQPPSTYTTYTGYLSGTATGDGGPNTDPTDPEGAYSTVVAVRPIVYLLYQCTDGVQYMDSFTIHTVPTNGGVPLVSQLAPGQQLVLGQGTANAETVTVSAVGATSPGYTSGTVTLTAATTKTHTAGDVICEPLPSGTTDATTWDTAAKFDSIAFAY